jgi:hypothetical protein
MPWSQSKRSSHIGGSEEEETPPKRGRVEEGVSGAALQVSHTPCSVTNAVTFDPCGPTLASGPEEGNAKRQVPVLLRVQEPKGLLLQLQLQILNTHTHTCTHHHTPSHAPALTRLHPATVGSR